MRNSQINIYEIILLGALLLLFIGGGALAVSLLSMSRDGWQTDFDKRVITLDEIVSGGVTKDVIAPVDRPRFESVEAAAGWLSPHSPVIVVTLHDTTRAYPLAVLLRHSIVNDHIKETPIAVTFCPFCNSAIVYDRELNGKVLRFGVTGNLYRSGFLMWDNMTESWWQQFTGKAVVGDYVGKQLDIIMSQVVSFHSFADRYPEGQVLAGDLNYPDIVYAITPYAGYDASPKPMLNNDQQVDDRLDATSRVLATTINGMPVAYAFDYLQSQQVINDTIAGVPVVAFWQPGMVSTADAPMISNSRDVGQAALYGRTVDGQMLTFHMEDKTLVDDQTGSTWNIFGEATSGDLQGATLPTYQFFPHFWFAWSMANPDTTLYK